MPVLAGKRVSISDGLEGQDDHFETLSALWDDLQLCSLDIAAQPECDLLSFSQSAFLLGVITVKREDIMAPLNPTRETITPHFPETVTPYLYKPPSHTSQPALSSSTLRYQHSSAILEDDISNVPSTAWLNDQRKNINPAWDPVSKESIKNHMKNFNAKETPGAGPSTIEDALENLMDHPTVEWSGNPDGHDRFMSSLSLPSLSSLVNRYLPIPPSTPPPPYIPQRAAPGRWDLPPRHETRDELIKVVAAGASQKAIGLIYLTASPLSHFPSDQVGELSLGIILDAAHRGKGYAREAIQLVVKNAFDVRQCHRIQAPLLHSSTKERMVSLLTQLRFGNEGTKRRAFFNPMMAEWQDVTTLAILDTDWAMRGLYKSAPKSLWDELFMRHERERDELLRWEDSLNRLKRPMTSSMETLRALPLDTDSSNTSESDAASSPGSASAHKGKKRAVESRRQDLYDGASSDADSEFDDTMFVRRYIPDPESRSSGASSPTLSDASLESVPRSVTTSGSDWDMVEPSSSGSSSFGDID